MPMHPIRLKNRPQGIPGVADGSTDVNRPARLLRRSPNHLLVVYAFISATIWRVREDWAWWACLNAQAEG
jgi:hypothetical protein